MAIKRLRQHTTAQDFKAEYDALRTVTRLNHPNIIETLAVFEVQDTDARYINFVSPLAFGNLKRLFWGDYGDDQSIIRRSASLWSQFLGLASAVAHLHESCHMAHRDIKPSNILIYQDQSTGDLTLRLTDFGLAVDLDNPVSWEWDSLAAQSALFYDLHTLWGEYPLTDEATKAASVPTAQDLVANDIWKLGCVFAQLLAFLVGEGPKGVSDLRHCLLWGSLTVPNEVTVLLSPHSATPDLTTGKSAGSRVLTMGDLLGGSSSDDLYLAL